MARLGMLWWGGGGLLEIIANIANIQYIHWPMGGRIIKGLIMGMARGRDFWPHFGILGFLFLFYFIFGVFGLGWAEKERVKEMRCVLDLRAWLLSTTQVLGESGSGKCVRHTNNYCVVVYISHVPADRLTD